MSSRLVEMFEDRELMEKIKERLPYLFRLAELESSRAGKIGMEVGVLRERIIIALLLDKFGEADVDTEIGTTEPEIDVKLSGKPISIKTITDTTITGSFRGVKITWTVDGDKVAEFQRDYEPCCDIIFVKIKWGDISGFYYIPLEAQEKLLGDIGREAYIKLPKPGTNPRGAEFTKEALSSLVENEISRVIQINWKKPEIEFDLYERWVDYWRMDQDESW